MQDIVQVGRDGWLFLTGGTNDVLNQYRRDAFTPAHYRGWRYLLENRLFRARQIGARYFHVVAPEKITICAEYSGLCIDTESAPSLMIRRWLHNSIAWGSLIDLVGPFRSDPRRDALCLKTDSHWSVLGCHRAYLQICARMGVSPRIQLVPSDSSQVRFIGDLGAKLPTQISELTSSWTYPRTAQRIHENAYLRRIISDRGSYGGGTGTRAVFRNTEFGVDPRTLILCGDSYAHQAYLPYVGALTAMFAETFREVHFFWATSVDWSYAAKLRPDFILTEIAERFMATLPPADFDHASFADQMEAVHFGQ